MAGVPGKSGGPRPNSGGARSGAGRPPKVPETPPAPPADVPFETDPLAYLLRAMNDPLLTPALRVRAAITAAQYKHTKRHDGGKKEEQQEAAERAGSGRFAPAAPPLKLVGGRK